MCICIWCEPECVHVRMFTRMQHAHVEVPLTLLSWGLACARRLRKKASGQDRDSNSSGVIHLIGKSLRHVWKSLGSTKWHVEGIRKDFKLISYRIHLFSCISCCCFTTLVKLHFVRCVDHWRTRSINMLCKYRQQTQRHPPREHPFCHACAYLNMDSCMCASNMHTHICRQTYVCMPLYSTQHAYMYIRIHAITHMCIYIHTCTYTYVHSCIALQTYTST